MTPPHGLEVSQLLVYWNCKYKFICTNKIKSKRNGCEKGGNFKKRKDEQPLRKLGVSFRVSFQSIKYISQRACNNNNIREVHFS